MCELRFLILLASAGSVGCFQTRISGSRESGSGGSSSGVSSSGVGTGSTASTGVGATSAGASSGGASSGGAISGGATGTGGGTTGSASASAGGSTTGPLPALVDGGYVFCSLPDAADAGPSGDGGLAFWLCSPGTYLCDLGGNIGNCFQCLSDADCTDETLPTFDPRRPRCDLSSGIAGYQNFCQECLSNADCAASAHGPLCDRNPNYPPSSGAVGPPGSSEEPSLAAVGFETCGTLQADCRLQGGPICVGSGQFCEPDSGICDYRSGYCSFDSDCQGPGHYCVSGRCFACDGTEGTCPLVCEGGATSQSYCPEHNSDGGQLRCAIEKINACACQNDGDCGGLWPRCRLDAGLGTINLPLGICGCDDNAECGDGGLVCIPSEQAFPYGELELLSTTMCGLPCTSPQAPACPSLFVPQGLGALPICDPDRGSCAECSNDQQCRSLPGAGGPLCLSSGGCGCQQDADCRPGESCLYSIEAQRQICDPQPRHCTPESCGAYDGLVCDRDSGECIDVGLSSSAVSCVSNLECGGGVCDPETQRCQACLENRDCRGSPAGDVCVSGFSDSPFCGCRMDSECAGALGGPRCHNHLCGCSTIADCTAGETCEGGSCRLSPPTPCNDAGACPSGLFCTQGFGGRDCVQCLSPIDCSNGGGCNSVTHTCGTCYSSFEPFTTRPFTGGPFTNPQGGTDCPPGDVCSSLWSPGASGACLPNCDLRSCPADRPLCATLPALTPDHAYCFGCLTDADCAGAGKGAFCDNVLGLTFTCQVR